MLQEPFLSSTRRLLQKTMSKAAVAIDPDDSVIYQQLEFVSVTSHRTDENHKNRSNQSISDYQNHVFPIDKAS